MELPTEGTAKQHRIGAFQGALMLAVAALFDGLQALLLAMLIGFVINWFITLIALLTFSLWFWLNGVSFWRGKQSKLFTLLAGGMIEMVPGLNGFPALTPTIAAVLFITRAEDTVHNKTHGKVTVQAT